MKKLLFLAAIALLWGCTSSHKADDSDHQGYVISGTVQHGAGQQIFLESLASNRPVIIDTAVIANDGSYKLKGFANQQAIHNIRVDRDYYIFFLMGNDHITLDFDLNNMENYTISGAPYGETMKRVFTDVVRVSEQTKQLQAQYRAAQTSTNFMIEARRIQGEHGQIIQGHYGLLKSIIDTVSNPLVGVFAANMMDAQAESKYLMDYSNKLSSGSHAKNTYVASFVDKMKQFKTLNVGEMAPDINLPGPNGEDMPLSSLKGQYVLIDFWASWCKPCRAANPHLVEVYNKYKNKNFTIYSVSLDRTKDRWVSAIEQDNLLWKYHVSDLKFWQCEAALAYSVKSIPRTFLIDPEGKIIATNLRGEAIDQKLEEIL